jgi:ABC-type lipoprotein export system ATPase subunit
MFGLDHIEPEPLSGQIAASGVWGRSLVLDPSLHHLVCAPSGKGKSTFLHLLYGLRSDYTGQITWQGKSTRSFSPDEWAALRRDQVAMVFQDLRLFPGLSAWDNLLLKNQLTGFFSEKELREHTERLGVAPFLTQKAETLSYGQRQRIAIVRALSQPFRYLLLDEPFSHLDAANAALAKALIDEQVANQGAAMVLATLGDDYGWPFQNRLVL